MVFRLVCEIGMWCLQVRNLRRNMSSNPRSEEQEEGLKQNNVTEEEGERNDTSEEEEEELTDVSEEKEVLRVTRRGRRGRRGRMGTGSGGVCVPADLMVYCIFPFWPNDAFPPRLLKLMGLL
eukprot:TRINITY_DN51169_c0_g1_i1.p4 TRINITY_DN51169_c0_g1~~TRINITY_DN51169_c0_g1_i1.p4  ORF type:complete len:122 (-),score=17.07 TRINITY_DN51169_c0_g1_i1:47-412(-)